MITKIDRGLTLEIVAAAAIASSTPVVCGAVVGIAVTSYAIGDTAEIWLEGKHLVNKAAEAWPTVGTKVYYDSVNSVFTVTAGANTFAGYTASVQQAGDAQGAIILRQ